MLRISNTLISFWMDAMAGTSRTLTVYSGVAPTVDANFTFAAANFTSQALASFTVGTTRTAQNVLQLTATPAPANATGTGTATWFALIAGTSVVIGSVGAQGTTSPLTVTNVQANTGSPFSLVQLAIKFTS